MGIMKFCRVVLVASAVLLGIVSQNAEAQLGIGIGFGSGGYGGAGIGGFYGSGYGHSHGYYGVGATIWPDRDTRFRRKTVKTSPQPGYLMGTVNFCPVESRGKQCAVPADLLQQTVINAIAKDSRQWISTQPTPTGTYQLILLPGTYYVTLSNPAMGALAQTRQEVTISPGQTVKREILAQPQAR